MLLYQSKCKDIIEPSRPDMYKSKENIASVLLASHGGNVSAVHSSVTVCEPTTLNNSMMIRDFGRALLHPFPSVRFITDGQLNLSTVSHCQPMRDFIYSCLAKWESITVYDQTPRLYSFPHYLMRSLVINTLQGHLRCYFMQSCVQTSNLIQY